MKPIRLDHLRSPSRSPFSPPGSKAPEKGDPILSLYRDRLPWIAFAGSAATASSEFEEHQPCLATEQPAPAGDPKTPILSQIPAQREGFTPHLHPIEALA